MRTSIYVDGFNLYYGCLRRSPYKWLDLRALFQKVLKKEHEITSINYFTALIKGKPDDLSAPQRQQAYIQALKAHISNIKVQYGFFQRHNVRMAKVAPPPRTVEVIKTEEKGSDVNLAVHLLNDAWRDNFDCGVVVSNDSDMAEAMKLIREHHPKKTLGLITPGSKGTSKKLKKYADFVKTLRESDLKASQLPDNIPGTNISKPSDWYSE